MANGDLAFTTSILVPVMLLVVMEITGIVRQLSLSGAVGERIEPTPHAVESRFNSILESMFEVDHVNELGHFQSLHAINCVILFSGIFMVSYAVTPPARLFLTFAVLVLFCILPYLEVTEYEEMRRNGTAIRSNIYHAVPSFFFGVLVNQIGRFARIEPNVPLIATLAIIVTLPYAVTQLYFSEKLASEVREAYGIGAK